MTWKAERSTAASTDMPNFKQSVQQAQKLIEQSELKEILLPLWRLIEFQGHAEPMAYGASLCLKGDAIIHLYPAVEQAPNGPQQVLHEFGKFVLLRAGNRGEALWKNKNDIPTKEQISIARGKLADPELRKTCQKYEDVLHSYPKKGYSVDRLVFINIANALLANNVAYPDSVGVDIMMWGPASEYCNLRKYHCLVPLASAYAPADVYEDYGHALASLLVDKLSRVRDHSVAYALRGMVQRIAKAASPAS